MAKYNNEPIVYAVSVNKTSGKNGSGTVGNSGLNYGTVQRREVAEHVTYTIKNRMGVELVIDADSVHELIAALQQAITPIY